MIRNWLIALALAGVLVPLARAQEVVVLSGVDDMQAWLRAEDWWGEEERGRQLRVPKAIITGINPAWRQNAQKLSVAEKKELFYRLMLPLVVHANDLVRERRSRLEAARETLSRGAELAQSEADFLDALAPLLRIERVGGTVGDTRDDLLAVVDEALYKLNVIPAGLVLGQAAYESGYGTSRFAISGNALFGQWTYGGQGLVPEQQRQELGDHRIAAFDWPFDSVRGYYLNLSSHPAYEDFRRLRAELQAAGKPLTSLALADGLSRYSERGAAYVETLKGVIRVNNLQRADGAVFRDEPMRFLVGAESPAAAADLRAEIEALRNSGELARIIARMQLD